MIVPFGFSVGDFVAAIGLTRDIISSLKGRGGAIDAFHSLLDELEVDCKTLDQLQSTSLPPQHASDEAAIRRQAGSLYLSALELFKIVREYDPAFTQQGADRFYRSVAKKTKWSLTMLEKIDRYRADVQAKSLSLRLMLERTNLILTAQALEVQSKAFQALQDQRDQMQSHYRSLADHVQRLENTMPSVLQIEDVVRSHVSTIVVPAKFSIIPWPAASQAQQISSTSPLPMPLPIRHQRLLSSSTQNALRYRGVHQTSDLTRHGPSHIFSEQPSVTFLKQQAEAVNQIAVGIVLLIQNLALFYPQLLVLFHLIQMRLKSIPNAISGLLSDNIVFIDFLGRQHSLQYCYFKEWSVVYAMLRTTFEQCRGSEYVLKHHFMLERQLSHSRFQPFNPQNWSQLQPGAKVIMSARLSKVPFKGRACSLCGQRVFSTARMTWFCDHCGIDIRPLDAEVLPASSELLEVAQRLAPSALGHTQRVKESRRSNRRFEGYLERIAVARWTIGPSSHLLGGLHEMQRHKTPPESSYDQLVAEVTQFWQQRAQVYQQVYTKTANVEKPFLGVIQNYKVRKGELLGQVADYDRELKDLRFFKYVSLRERAALHDAALRGNTSLLAHLISTGEDPLTSRGAWGTTIDAAILSGSVNTVEFLLQKGADPLATTGVLGNPIRVASLKGYHDVLHLLLDWSWDQCMHDIKPFSLFQTVIDAALLLATMAGQSSRVLELLLFYGANPFHLNLTRDSSFSAAYIAGYSTELDLFIRAAHERRILPVETAKALLLKLLDPAQIDLHLPDAELDIAYIGFRDGTSSRFEDIMSGRWLCDLKADRRNVLPSSARFSSDEDFHETHARHAVVQDHCLADNSGMNLPITPTIVVNGPLM